MTAALAVFDEDGDGLVPLAELKRILGWSFPGSKPLDVREIDQVLVLLGGGPARGMISAREVAAAFSAPRFRHSGPNGATRVPLPPRSGASPQPQTSPAPTQRHTHTHSAQADTGLASHHTRLFCHAPYDGYASVTGAAAAYYEFVALIASVESGAVAPLRGSWLLRLYEQGGRLQRRQDLPAEAFWSAAELRALVDAAMRHFSDDPQARAPPSCPHTASQEELCVSHTHDVAAVAGGPQGAGLPLQFALVSMARKGAARP